MTGALKEEMNGWSNLSFNLYRIEIVEDESKIGNIGWESRGSYYVLAASMEMAISIAKAYVTENNPGIIAECAEAEYLDWFVLTHEEGPR